MALRAGYYGVKRFLRDKLETIAGTYDETIKSMFPRSEQAVLGAKNIFYPTYAGGTEKTVVITKNADNSYTLNGSPDDGNMAVVLWEGKMKKGNYILNGVPDFTTYGARLHIREASGAALVNAIDTGTGVSFVIPSDTTIYQVLLYLNNGYTASNLVVRPMIRLATDPDDTYVPYAMTNLEITNSVVDQKTAINAIITAATGAADFAAFKTAMGAITPVTRSLSLTKEDITEEVKEDVEPEKTVTKKRTTKKTEEV